MAQQIQLRNDTTAGWEYANPVLAQAEVGVDTTLIDLYSKSAVRRLITNKNIAARH
jgi:hypothetical protein